MIFNIAVSSEGFGFYCAMTKRLSLIVLINRSTRLVALGSPTGLNIFLTFCSRQNY